MPTYYFIVTNKKVKSLVDANNLVGLDDYLSTNVDIANDELIKRTNAEDCEDDNNSDSSDDSMTSEHTSYENKLYHILSYAVDKANTLVLEHFSNKINADYSPDGNAYHLIDLAVENYIDDVDNYTPSNKDRYDTIILLLSSHAKNYENSTNCFNFPTRRLVGFCNKYDNYDLLRIFIKTYGASLWDVYHYSIAWNVPKVFDKLVSDDEFYNSIDFGWTSSAVEMAYRFDYDNMALHVINKLEQTHPETFEKLKHLKDRLLFILKQSHDLTKLVFPESTICIRTSYDFDKPIDMLILPPKLKRIEFGPNFNQQLDAVIFPPTLESITFGINHNWACFNKSIKAVKFPQGLKEYRNVGKGCNESLDNVKFPASLEILGIGYEFNKDISKVIWPTSLKKIIFGNDFDQSLKKVKFNKLMNTIECHQMTTSLAINTLTHPVKTLELSCIGADIIHLPPGLEFVQCHPNERKHIQCELPQGCVYQYSN